MKDCRDIADSCSPVFEDDEPYQRFRRHYFFVGDESYEPSDAKAKRYQGVPRCPWV